MYSTDHLSDVFVASRSELEVRDRVIHVRIDPEAKFASVVVVDPKKTRSPDYQVFWGKVRDILESHVKRDEVFLICRSFRQWDIDIVPLASA